MILNKTSQISILQLLLLLVFSQLLFAQTYLSVNSGGSGTLSSTGATGVHYTVFPAGRTYTISAGGGDTKLYVYLPNGGSTVNEDWGGMTNTKFSQVTGVALAGSYTFYVQSSAGNFNYFIFITDVSPCPNSCTSKVFY